MTTKRILSIDGGGIRGIIPALILAHLEKRLNKRTAELFNMMAGTSTGGILALGLSKPDRSGSPALTASNLVSLYTSRGKEVFPRSLWKRATSFSGLSDEIYASTGLESVLRDYLGGVKLSEAMVDLLIPAYDIERRNAVFFKSHRAKVDPERDYWMSHIARATSAAPTYFEPANISNALKTYQTYLIDGGVFANNPASCAMAEAQVVYPEATDIILVSLGTGELTRRIPYDDAKNWGKIGWMRPMLDVMFDGVADTVHYQMQMLMPPKDGSPRYFRFQVILDEGNDDMDDASSTNIRALTYKAEKLIEEQSDKLDVLCNLLAAPRE